MAALRSIHPAQEIAAPLVPLGNRLPSDPNAGGGDVVVSNILFIEDLAQLVRASRATIERRRRDGSLPFPELPAIDKRPRWSRRVVDEVLSSSANGGTRRFAQARLAPQEDPDTAPVVPS